MMANWVYLRRMLEERMLFEKEMILLVVEGRKGGTMGEFYVEEYRLLVTCFVFF